jgi:signal transduction histidine kinase
MATPVSARIDIAEIAGNVTAEELARRKEWLEFGPDDVTRLGELNALASQSADALIENLYEHFLAFPETSKFFDEPAVLEHAKNMQRAYFLQLTEGEYDENYVNGRLMVGAVHEELGVDVKWYLGAYQRYLRAIGERISNAYEGEPDRAMDCYYSLGKLIFLDIGFAIDAYIIRREHTIKKQQEELETIQQRRRTLTDIVYYQEEERRRLAGDIHDDAVQSMTAVLLRIGLLGARLDEPDQLSLAKELEGNIRDTIARLRRLIVGLSPPELDRAGLTSAVRSALDQLKLEFQIDYSLENRVTREPGPEARTIAYRIVQEALANTRKHANASRVEVSLETQEHGLCTIVSDDGVGFDVEAILAVDRPGHLGLKAMRERAELAEGWLRIESRPGATKVTFWIPREVRRQPPTPPDRRK